MFLLPETYVFRMRNVRFRDWKHKRLHAEIEKGPLVFGINSVHQLFIDTEYAVPFHVKVM